MPDVRKIRFARMRLVGLAIIYWISIEMVRERQHEDPIEVCGDERQA